MTSHSAKPYTHSLSQCTSIVGIILVITYKGSKLLLLASYVLMVKQSNSLPSRGPAGAPRRALMVDGRRVEKEVCLHWVCLHSCQGM